MRGTGIILPRTTVGVSRWRRFRAAVDWPLILVVLAICGIGLVNLFSATNSPRHHAKFDKQMQWMLLGALSFAIATIIDYRAMVRLAWIGLWIAVASLVLVRLLGANAQGSHRWFDLGGAGHLQPSEPAKLLVILALSRMFHDHDTGAFSLAGLLGRMSALLLPMVLIAIQPDLGTAILLALICLSVGYLSMTPVWPMVVTTLLGLLAVPVLWETMHTYQKDRILAFIDTNPTGNGYHTWQSILAVGSGRVFGKGFGEGTQNKLNFLPEHWTDFPFSVWGEEWGFVGCLFLIALFGFLLVWILNVALSAKDRMGAVICVGVAAMTFWHVLVNIAMVLGLAPVVGVTLPFISYGGSSLITFFLAMGLVSNVSLRKHGY